MILQKYNTHNLDLLVKPKKSAFIPLNISHHFHTEIQTTNNKTSHFPCIKTSSKTSDLNRINIKKILSEFLFKISNTVIKKIIIFGTNPCIFFLLIEKPVPKPQKSYFSLFFRGRVENRNRNGILK